jgi:hypothetical protein
MHPVASRVDDFKSEKCELHAQKCDFSSVCSSQAMVCVPQSLLRLISTAWSSGYDVSFTICDEIREDREFNPRRGYFCQILCCLNSLHTDCSGESQSLLKHIMTAWSSGYDVSFTVNDEIREDREFNPRRGYFYQILCC